jgi:hypothetical protein
MSWFKKDLTEAQILNLYTDLSLAESWTREHRKRLLTREQKMEYVDKVSKLRGTIPSKEEIQKIVLMELTNSLEFDENLKNYRKNSGYDNGFELLCKTAKLDESFYKK